MCVSNIQPEILSDPKSQKKDSRQKIKTEPKKSGKILKLLLGVILFAAVLFWRDNYLRLLDIFETFSLVFFLLTIISSLYLNLLSSYKWKLIVDQFERIPLKRLFSIYIIGKYFSNFLPSMVGGDISRIYILGKQLRSNSKAVASIVLERITGLIALILIAGVFSLFNLKILQNETIEIALGGMILLGIVLTLLLFTPEFFRPLERRLIKFRILKKPIEIINRLNDDIIFLRKKPKLLIKTMILSFVFHLSTSILVYSACMSINFHPSFWSVLLISPVIFLIISVPISPNNIGWAEWVFAILLISAGANSAQGLAVALTIRAAVFCVSAPGAFLASKETIEFRRKTVNPI